ncbi:MAG: hypothetical protein ACTSRP_15390, partial [Candidatus Helarchaeota archaeon]
SYRRSIIEYTVKPSEVGIYNYTIQFMDPEGQRGNDTVIVKVLYKSDLPRSIMFQWEYLYEFGLVWIFLIQISLILIIVIYSWKKSEK